MFATQNYLASAEALLNPIDWCPVASSYSGAVRYLAGFVQLIASAVFAYISIVQLLLAAPRIKWIRPMLRVYLQDAWLGCKHAAANMARGVFAMMPILNMLLWVYDNKIGRFDYPLETRSFKVYPIGSAKFLAH